MSPRRPATLPALARLALPLLFAGCAGCAEELRPPSAMRRFEIPLWPAGAPSSNGLAGPERGSGCIENVSLATLTVSLPAARAEPVPAVLVCPGGGYRAVCVEHEGEDTTEWLLGRGLAAVVLKYRLPNGHREVPGDDVRQALRTVRERAAEWGIDPGRVAAWGFSAGGHLVATAATGAGTGEVTEGNAARPDLLVLCYPVVSMETGVTHAGSRRELLGTDPDPERVAEYSLERRADEGCPPTLLLHAADDAAVPLANSERLRDRLAAVGVPVHLVTYEHGGHGPGMFAANPGWREVVGEWLAENGWR